MQVLCNRVCGGGAGDGSGGGGGTVASRSNPSGLAMTSKSVDQILTRSMIAASLPFALVSVDLALGTAPTSIASAREFVDAVGALPMAAAFKPLFFKVDTTFVNVEFAVGPSPSSFALARVLIVAVCTFSVV